jgi:hypothetical protein
MALLGDGSTGTSMPRLPGMPGMPTLPQLGSLGDITNTSSCSSSGLSGELEPSKEHAAAGGQAAGRMPGAQILSVWC